MHPAVRVVRKEFKDRSQCELWKCNSLQIEMPHLSIIDIILGDGTMINVKRGNLPVKDDRLFWPVPNDIPVPVLDPVHDIHHIH